MSNKLMVAYTEDYKNKCFIFWYLSGRPNAIAPLLKDFPKDENGRVPKVNLINLWKNEMGWVERADELDAKAMDKVDDVLIMQKAAMLKNQANEGALLQQKGLAYLLGENGIDSSAVALNAVIKGAELERTSRGMSEFILRMSKMSNEDIKNEILKLSSRTDVDNIIDVEEVKDDSQSE